MRTITITDELTDNSLFGRNNTLYSRNAGVIAFDRSTASWVVSVCNSRTILDRSLDHWSLLYLESVINHHQKVDYNTNFECREDQCHAGKTCKCKTIYTCIYWQIGPIASMLADKTDLSVFRFFKIGFRFFSVFRKPTSVRLSVFSKPRFRFGFRLTNPTLVYIIWLFSFL